MTTAYQTLGIQMAIAQYLNGQNAGYTPNFNGLPEAINDNSTASWDGNNYATYGGITRGGEGWTSPKSTPTHVNRAIQDTTRWNTYRHAQVCNNHPQPRA